MQKTNKAESQAATWEEIKKEYVTTKISMREIARKYGYAVSSVSERAKREGWKKTAERIANRTEQKYIEKVSDARASNADKAMKIIDKLMDKLGKSIDVVKDGDVQAMKQLVGAMKDLRDIGVFDMGEKKDISVNIKLEGELEDYAQ